MKCAWCPACFESYEYNEFTCWAGFEEEMVDFKDGESGCRRKLKTIEKMMELHDCTIPCVEAKCSKELWNWYKKWESRQKKEAKQ